MGEKEIKHHKQLELCKTRPAYRQGKKLTAIKTYTINNESQHLFVYGVPSINLRTELKTLFEKYGRIIKLHPVKEVKTEIFTECFHIQFDRIQSSRIAKKLTDNKNFYGGILHVCYAPEQETLEETRKKLQQRRKDVYCRLRSDMNSCEGISGSKNYEIDYTKISRKRKQPALEITDERLARYGLDSDVIWKGIPQELDPRLPQKEVDSVSCPVKHFQLNAQENLPRNIEIGPYLPGEDVLKCNNEQNETSLKDESKNFSNLSKKIIPTQVVKLRKLEENKRIVFKRKIRKLI